MKAAAGGFPERLGDTGRRTGYRLVPALHPACGCPVREERLRGDAVPASIGAFANTPRCGRPGPSHRR